MLCKDHSGIWHGLGGSTVPIMTNWEVSATSTRSFRYITVSEINCRTRNMKLRLYDTCMDQC
jgi:hypothetical protein